MADIPRLMTGVKLVGHGDYDMLQVRSDISVPQPGAIEVLIRVEASAVNNTDINTRLAWYSKGDGDAEDAGWSGALELPRIQGADICGRIVAVGKEVSSDRIGERVIVEPVLFEAGDGKLHSPWYVGSECNGGFAEYAVVASRHAHFIESDWSSEELATLPCSYSTAENMLTRARVTNTDTVFVTGASGGVGSAAVQLAKARGAKVIAVTSPSKFDDIRAIGADIAIDRGEDYRTNPGRNSVDVVIDLVAGEKWPSLLDILKPKGRYAVSGAIGGAFVELDVRTLYLKDLSFFGCTVIEPEVFPNLVKLVEEGRIKPLLAETYPLADLVKAQKAFLKKCHVGKIAIKIASD